MKKRRAKRRFRLSGGEMGFEPQIRFWRIHDFQSCSFGQLGHLSIASIAMRIARSEKAVYQKSQKGKQVFKNNYSSNYSVLLE